MHALSSHFLFYSSRNTPYILARVYILSSTFFSLRSSAIRSSGSLNAMRAASSSSLPQHPYTYTRSMCGDLVCISSGQPEARARALISTPLLRQSLLVAAVYASSGHCNCDLRGVYYSLLRAQVLFAGEESISRAALHQVQRLLFAKYKYTIYDRGESRARKYSSIYLRGCVYIFARCKAD